MRIIGGRAQQGLVVAAVAALGLGITSPSQAGVVVSRPAWAGFAGDAQHTATAPASPQPLASIHWTAPVDLDPPSTDDSGPLAHYASPMITQQNTVVVPTRLRPPRGFALRAYAGGDGAPRWRLHTDYTVPASARGLWPGPLPAGMRDDHHVAVAAAGGTLLVRSHVDGVRGRVHRIAFYGIRRWRAHRAAYAANVAVATPLTTGPDGSTYFGFSATKAAPGRLRNGIARISPSGHGTWVSARSLAGAHHGSHVVLNCAPALSPDGRTAYVAVLAGKRPLLVGFHAGSLRPEYRHELRDPQTSRLAALVETSSATPTVGPDGDVFYGVEGNPLLDHDARGWLLHFDATLQTVETPGSFGWDQTPSVVPASAVPSYAGTSSYLLVSKYNNYALGPYGDGQNELALLDPHDAQTDRFSAVSVMREVRTVLSPTHPPGSPGDTRYEWCINSIVVDPVTGVAIANNEDGHVYSWDLDSGKLTEAVMIGNPRGQAYTETEIGPDGTAYAITNGVLYALGG